jgi:hypothetical protein
VGLQNGNFGNLSVLNALPGKLTQTQEARDTFLTLQTEAGPTPGVNSEDAIGSERLDRLLTVTTTPAETRK